MSLLLLVLTAVAITTVWSEASLFRPLREHGPAIWKYLADCPLCSGVWIGWFWGYFWLRPATLEGFAELFGLGALVGVLSLAVRLVFDLFDKHG